MIFNLVELNKKKSITTKFLLCLLRLIYVNQTIYLLMDNFNWLLNSIIQIKSLVKTKSASQPLKKNKRRLLVDFLREFDFNYYSNFFWLNSSLLYLIKNFYDFYFHFQTLIAIKKDKDAQKYGSSASGLRDLNSSSNVTNVPSTSSSMPTSSIYLKNQNRRRVSTPISQKLNLARLAIIKYLKFIFLKYTSSSDTRRFINALALETLKNLCDLLLPMSNLNLINLSTGKQGLIGLLSSLISLYFLY